MAGNLVGKTRIPKRSERLWRCLLAHNLNHIRPRDKAGTWKSLQNCTGAEEMIAVAMGGVDRRQILSARHDPIRQGARLLDRNRSVHQDSVPSQGCILSHTSGVGVTAVGLSVPRMAFVSSDWPRRGRYESDSDGIR